MPGRQAGVLYLTRDKLQIYSPYFPQIFEFRFVPELIRDMEIINSELLENVLKMFIANSKIPPSNMIMVLADNASFIKDISVTQDLLIEVQKQSAQKNPGKVMDELLQQEANKYIEHLPFEKIMNKTFPLKGGIRVYAVNQDFYDAFKVIFEHMKFSIDCVLPGIVFSNNISSRPMMDVSMAAFINQNANLLLQNNLLLLKFHQNEPPKDQGELFTLGEQAPPKTDKKRMAVLSSVFGVLVIILIVVSYTSNQQPRQSYKSSAAPPPASTIQNNIAPPNTNTSAVNPVIPTVVPTAALSSQVSDPKLITMQIINASLSDQLGPQLRNQFAALGFKSINLQRQTTLNMTGILVMFSPKPSQQIRNTVLTEVRKNSALVNIQEKPDAAFDVIVVIGK